MRTNPLRFQLVAGLLGVATGLVGVSGCGVDAAAVSHHAARLHVHEGSASSASPRQTKLWRLTKDRVSSRTWETIDGSGPTPSPSPGFTVQSSGLVTLAVSATLSGASVEVRLLDDGKAKGPKFVSFSPTGTRSGFSYTFADVGRARRCGHTFVLQWRSRSNHLVVLSYGNVVVTYTAAQGPPQTCPHG